MRDGSAWNKLTAVHGTRNLSGIAPVSEDPKVTNGMASPSHSLTSRRCLSQESAYTTSHNHKLPRSLPSIYWKQ